MTPDPLVALDGSPISGRDDWYERRVPELRSLFRSHVYGRAPVSAAVKGAVRFEGRGGLGGPIDISQTDLVTTDGLLHANLLLALPSGASTPVPCFLGLNFKGNDEVLADARAYTNVVEGKRPDVTWPVQEVVGRGYAFATVQADDIVPDNLEGAVPALARLRPGQGPATASDPGAIAAWAWGLSRVMDYLESHPRIDSRRVALFGHSRFGKTALFAAAMDDRFAMVVGGKSGTGGAAPWRVGSAAGPPGTGVPVVEGIGSITTRFGYWFCPALQDYRDDADALPVEQNELLALCAPRPVLLSNATEDHWVNPPGQRSMLEAAGPVYDLVLGPGEGYMPPTVEVGVLQSNRLGWFIRPGGHSTNVEDWRAWLAYAERWL